MGMIVRSTILLVALLAWSIGLAQVERTVDGRKFYVHEVQAGQTLYAISRSYAVPVTALMAANPGVETGLSIGQELLVPVDAIVKKEARNAPVLMQDGELKHTVAKRETLFGIAKQYGVEINALLERNPILNSGVQPGMEVIIPVEALAGRPGAITRPAGVASGRQHVVQAGETLYALGKRYGVAPEAIQHANGGLPEGLKAGMTVLIPSGTGGEVSPVRADTLMPLRKSTIGLLLPFAIARNDSMLAAARTGETPRYYEPTRIASQFYAGARMALDSLERSGLNAEVVVVDVGDDPKTWNAALRSPELARVDLYLGPFHRSAIEQLARVSTRAHIVCPVPQSAKLILGHPGVSKVTPTRSDLIKHSARYVAQRHAQDNIILFKPEIPGEKEQQDLMARSLQEALNTRTTKLRDTVLVVRSGVRDLGDLPAKLDPARLNVIVSANEDVEFVTSLVGKLKPLAAKYRIALVGMEKWQHIASVDIQDLDVLGFLFAAGSFADPTDVRLQAFSDAFRERYKAEVDEYALLGFDVTYYYVKALMTLGPGFTEHFDRVYYEPLSTGFRMTRTGPENGFRNEYAVMLQQKDLQLVKAP